MVRRVSRKNYRSKRVGPRGSKSLRKRVRSRRSKTFKKRSLRRRRSQRMRGGAHLIGVQRVWIKPRVLKVWLEENEVIWKNRTGGENKGFKDVSGEEIDIPSNYYDGAMGVMRGKVSGVGKEYWVKWTRGGEINDISWSSIHKDEDLINADADAYAAATQGWRNQDWEDLRLKKQIAAATAEKLKREPATHTVQQLLNQYAEE